MLVSISSAASRERWRLSESPQPHTQRGSPVPPAGRDVDVVLGHPLDSRRRGNDTLLFVTPAETGVQSGLGPRSWIPAPSASGAFDLRGNDALLFVTPPEGGGRS